MIQEASNLDYCLLYFVLLVLKFLLSGIRNRHLIFKAIYLGIAFALIHTN